MREKYDAHIIGKVALSVFRHHKGSNIVYELSDEAQTYFDGILDNLASQFNSHYDMGMEITESQPDLNEEQRADIDVRTKAAELIGRLSAVLWIYNNGEVIYDTILLSTEPMKSCPYVHIEYTFCSVHVYRFWETLCHTPQNILAMHKKC